MYINERVARQKAQETEYYLKHQAYIDAKLSAYRDGLPFTTPKKEPKAPKPPKEKKPRKQKPPTIRKQKPPIDPVVRAEQKAQYLREWRAKNKDRVKLHHDRAKAKREKDPKELEKRRTYMRDYARAYRRRKKEEANAH